MKIDFSRTMTDFEGQPVQNGQQPLTLGVVAARALNATGDPRSSPDDALARGMLAFKVYGQTEADVTPEDLALIRKMLPVAWAPMIVAQAHEMLGG
ncbi:hypothetical protein SAMN05444007_108259 [Cribrihabitans marinus]|uniref:Uncharacterized protein n=1 Tax=Cribrihabitans marinus TaxID=1227549 RepID=A0A1H7CXA2_9RHOB|nr:hypothetical protein [Cribrihabitans marinus]GGH36401.1 hypothetical protein GCM10010973_30300 [Cribrihabitans marinus]SEJ91822.1 hypothetical protein SAMN05444007_108259 [Cribrihabitans marinus]